MKELCKNYKPEILCCPICGNKLSYRHAVSNKVVHFSSGKTFKIRNLGYGCDECKDKKIYVSQTANKLSFKGYTFSAKVACMIYYYKNKGYGREYICDLLSTKGVEMSDRNVDIIYNKVKQLFMLNPDDTIPNAYNNMLENYNQIRLSIDIITIDSTVFLLIYDFFSTELLVIKEFNTTKDERLKEFLCRYINKDLKITVITSIRREGYFIPMLKSICPSFTKIIPYQKF